MKTDINYSASDCFETFPFPESDPRSSISDVELAGERLYKARRQFMETSQQGLTATHNLLTDAECKAANVVELRRLHEEMDEAVLDAYGWSDLDVPPYRQSTSEADARARQEFEDELLDRLFVLNEKRATEERLTAARRRKESRKAGEEPGAQGKLFE